MGKIKIFNEKLSFEKNTNIVIFLKYIQNLTNSFNIILYIYTKK